MHVYTYRIVYDKGKFVLKYICCYFVTKKIKNAFFYILVKVQIGLPTSFFFIAKCNHFTFHVSLQEFCKPKLLSLCYMSQMLHFILKQRLWVLGLGSHLFCV